MPDLDYLLRNKQDVTLPIGPTDEAILITLDEIRKGLQKIHNETTVLPDTSGELTKKNLALLNWEITLIEQLISTINGLLNYNTNLSNLPDGFKLSVELSAKLSYDEISKRLQFSGVMTLNEKNHLDTLSNGQFL